MPLSRRSLLVAVGGVALAACTTRKEIAGGARPGPAGDVDGTPVATAPPPGVPLSSLAMVGDSITLASEEQLRSALGSKGITDVTIDAEQGRRIEVGNGKKEPLSGRKTLARMLQAGVSPSVWVLALGTNDVSGYPREGYVELIDTMLAMLPATTPLVWVDTYRPRALDATLVFNEVLRDRVGARPHAVVASWFAVASNPANHVLRSDDVHPNDAGRVAFATVVAEALGQLG